MSAPKLWFTEDRALLAQLAEYRARYERSEITAAQLRDIGATYKRLIEVDFDSDDPSTQASIGRAAWDTFATYKNLEALSAKELVRLALEQVGPHQDRRNSITE